MSYFAAGYGNNTSVIKDFEKSFADIVPSIIKEDVLRIEEKRSFLLNYGGNKAIDDIVYKNRESGSWFAALGTPLLKLDTEEEKEGFLNRLISDPKTILNNEIDGCFALLLYNASADKLVIATDINNTTPIYYATKGESVYISSHELQLARLLRPEIDPIGFSQTIHLGLTWGGQTRFKNIHKLLPCQIITFRGNGRHHFEEYWRPSDEIQWPADFDDVIDKWLILLKKSVNAFYDRSKEDTVLCDFTAGEDARLILSECHALKIPFKAQVTGLDTDIDVLIAKKAAQEVGFDLTVRPKLLITEEQLMENATYISLVNDAYQDYFKSCTDYATNRTYTALNYRFVKFTGLPGGEAFRGSYYLRGKALFPSSRGAFDHRFFTKMKYLLDFHPGLLRFSDEECRKIIFKLVEGSLEDVTEFPVGIKIDHLLRVFQTCNTGLIYKNPRYLPLATNRMTRSIYAIPAKFKRGGKLTKACTEILYPEVAFIKTQKGVPTVRKTLLRSYLFFPEHFAMARGVLNGAMSRLLKWTESNKPYYKLTDHAPAMITLLNKPPYADWFSSSNSMLTGYLYNGDVVDKLFSNARVGVCRYVPILGRIINQELACRWVYGEK